VVDEALSFCTGLKHGQWVRVLDERDGGSFTNNASFGIQHSYRQAACGWCYHCMTKEGTSSTSCTLKTTPYLYALQVKIEENLHI